MTVVMDGKEIEGDGPGGSLERMRELLRVRRLVPARLKVDGAEVGLSRLRALAGGEASVELETVALKVAAENAYGEAAAHLPKMEQSIERCFDFLMLGNVREAMQSFTRVCSGVSSFFALMKPLDALVGVDPRLGWGREAEDMKPLLIATEEAISQQDWVLVCDQLRYEWSPRMRVWVDRLPQARAEAARLAAVS